MLDYLIMGQGNEHSPIFNGCSLSAISQKADGRERHWSEAIVDFSRSPLIHRPHEKLLAA
jgi:hypothetical protein